MSNVFYLFIETNKKPPLSLSLLAEWTNRIPKHNISVFLHFQIPDVVSNYPFAPGLLFAKKERLASRSLPYLYILFAQRFGFIQLEHFFRSKTNLRHRNLLGREAEIMGIRIADADHISQFVPIVVGIKAVMCHRFLDIFQPSVTAGKTEAVPVMDQSALANFVESVRFFCQRQKYGNS